jgi:hypothetical protein
VSRIVPTDASRLACNVPNSSRLIELQLQSHPEQNSPSAMGTRMKLRIPGNSPDNGLSAT